ncbi:hypothetical protein PRIPAC_85600 [Pristionchus pacificus]|uniref:Cytochrome P450 n=1 Tax=Pristionchus pacificus TaxID=54126 RepID=A0A2A6BNU3_PRIPA|nr:hypothetical protein PRIPAC_85600 [Pristionchus pacificus]|eukprot:PDM67574.1 cytochrome P450 [Pristionchus pacificus]
MLIVLLLAIAVVVYHYGINRILGLPPGPPPLPLIGNMLSFRWDLDNVLLDWKARYGRVFTVWLPAPMVVIGDHQLLQEHVVKNGDVYLAKKNPEQFMDIMSGGLYGLVFEDNDMVKEQRKFAMKSLHEVGFGSAALEDTVHNNALETVSRWKKSGEEVVDVTENIMKSIGNVVWNVTFGITLDFDNEIVPTYRRLQQDSIPLMAGPFMMFIEMFPFLRNLEFLFGNPIKKLKVMLDKSNGMTVDAIRTTEKSFNPDNQPSSYVEAFLREMKKNEEAGKPMGNFHFDQLRNAAATIWGAGFDTTVGLLRMCCLELINHSDVQMKLQKEIDEVIGERRVVNDDQKQLPNGKKHRPDEAEKRMRERKDILPAQIMTFDQIRNRITTLLSQKKEHQRKVHGNRQRRYVKLIDDFERDLAEEGISLDDIEEEVDLERPLDEDDLIITSGEIYDLIYRLGNVLPINFLRKTTQDTEIEGYRIASGTTVLPQFSMVHADPNEFERPDYFCPDRHIDDAGAFIKDPRITPFSIGKRACLGETLARMEIFVMFATFVQNCHFTPVGKVPPAVEFNYGFTRSVNHFDVKIEPRN